MNPVSPVIWTVAILSRAQTPNNPSCNADGPALPAPFQVLAPTGGATVPRISYPEPRIAYGSWNRQPTLCRSSVA